GRGERDGDDKRPQEEAATEAEKKALLNSHITGFPCLPSRLFPPEEEDEEEEPREEILGMESGSTGEGHIKGVPTHGGRYVQYNVYGTLFEVTAKYVPPLRSIGRGSCGIVW
ncbi:hypothetical protein B296_00027021, partial [Ensete ventricosum]